MILALNLSWSVDLQRVCSVFKTKAGNCQGCFFVSPTGSWVHLDGCTIVTCVRIEWELQYLCIVHKDNIYNIKQLATFNYDVRLACDNGDFLSIYILLIRYVDVYENTLSTLIAFPQHHANASTNPHPVVMTLGVHTKLSVSCPSVEPVTNTCKGKGTLV